ncbi:MAG TPA: ABC-type transport auxiliary lipoprotein family protein [Polyangiaceae bacterium]|nr:ABC-type transport auxiliary lipoprotein family protein [Polyangiaceae bacterium]
MLTKALLPATLALLLAGCVSLTPDPPASLLTLTPVRTAPAGATAAGDAASALAVIVPETDQRLNVVRVPVQTSDSSLAYLKDAVWVEKPARLFQQLLAETIRAGGSRLVVGEGDFGYAAATKLSGRLLDMGFDASSGSVVVRFDAVLQTPDGKVRTQRFENRVSGIEPKAEAVGPALNDAANAVAGEVADWVR